MGAAAATGVGTGAGWAAGLGKTFFANGFFLKGFVGFGAAAEACEDADADGVGKE